MVVNISFYFPTCLNPFFLLFIQEVFIFATYLLFTVGRFQHIIKPSQTMKIQQLIVFLFAVVLIDARTPKRYSELDIVMLTCTTFIGKYGTVCTSTGKRSTNWNCYCKTDAGFGTISDCLVRGFNNNTNIISKFTESCNMTESKFHAKYDKIQAEFKTNGTEYAKMTTKSSSGNKTSASASKSSKSTGLSNASKSSTNAHGSNSSTSSTSSSSSKSGKGNSGTSTTETITTPLLIDYKNSLLTRMLTKCLIIISIFQ